MKQTAVEWFNEEIKKLNVGTDARVFIAKLFEQSNKMFERQIIDAHMHGHNAPSSTLKNFDAKQYYDQTFKSE
jgi:hypothetical protein